MPLPAIAVGALALAGLYKIVETATRQPATRVKSNISEVDPETKCPACERPMRRVTMRGVEVDECPFCGGQWFDTGEMEAIHAMSPIPRRFLTVYQIDGEQTVASGDRCCVRCGDTLAPVEHKGITIDACVRCKGIWLDHGELADLITDPE